MDKNLALRLSEPIEAAYLDAVDALIINIARHLGTGKAFRTASWETLKLAELGQLTEENAKIINEDEVTGEYVNVGLRVTVEDVDSKESMDFIIVGSTEADPFAEPAKISNESEVGKNLLGKKIGETVEITVPDGILHYRVTAISKE